MHKFVSFLFVGFMKKMSKGRLNKVKRKRKKHSVEIGYHYNI